MAHIHPIYDTDKIFTIDPFTRLITCEADAKLTLMQFDHNSERYTFELPRTIEGHDMSLCNRALIHYLNASSGKKNPGVYEVKDLALFADDESYVGFSWTISDEATQLSGSLNFMIEFSCISDEGVEEYSWHTAIFGGIKVGEGYDFVPDMIDRHADILEQWRQELVDAGILAAELAATKAVEKLNAALTRINGSLTLEASKWSENSQTVEIEGVLEDSGLFFTPATKEDRAAASKAGLFVTAVDGTVTFTVDELPTVDINLSYFIMGIEYSNEVTA